MLAYFKSRITGADNQDKEILSNLNKDSFLFLCEPAYPLVHNAIFDTTYLYSYKDILVICDEKCLGIAKNCPSQKKIFWVYNNVEDMSVLNDEDLVCVTSSPELSKLYNIRLEKPENVRFGEDGKAIL